MALSNPALFLFTFLGGYMLVVSLRRAAPAQALGSMQGFRGRSDEVPDATIRRMQISINRVLDSIQPDARPLVVNGVYGPSTECALRLLVSRFLRFARPEVRHFPGIHNTVAFVKGHPVVFLDEYAVIHALDSVFQSSESASYAAVA